MVPKTLTKDLTSYDLLKTFAVILMIVDHTGYYFFDDDEWWRAIGRFCVPVWFFLIGYARSRDLGPLMWGGMIVLAAASWISGMGLFPLNILASIIVVRLVLDAVMARAMLNERTFWQISTLMLFLVVPSSYAFEYGTLAVILAMYGWLLRHQAEIEDGVRLTFKFFGFTLAAFVFFQILFFDFTQIQVAVMTAGCLLVMALLPLFRPTTFAGSSSGVWKYLFAPVRLIGRHTLEIYVLHLLTFKALGVLTQPERFQMFSFHLFMP